MYAALKVMKDRLPVNDGSFCVNYYYTLCCIIEDELQVIFLHIYGI